MQFKNEQMNFLLIKSYISKFSVGLYLIDSTAFENKFFAPFVKPEMKRYLWYTFATIAKTGPTLIKTSVRYAVWN